MNARRKAVIALVLLGLGYLTATWIVLNRTGPLASERPVTLRLAHWQIERGPPEGLAAVIKRYEELNPRVKVEQVLVPSTLYRQWLRSNLAGGTGADLIEFGYFLGNINDVPPRYFEPLTELLAQPNPYNRGTVLEGVPWRLTFSDGLWGPRAMNPDVSELYAVTLGQGSLRLFCNRDLLREVTGEETVPQTLEEFRQLARRLAEHAQRTGRTLRPLAGSRDNALWLMGTLMQSPVTDLNLGLDHEGFLNLAPRPGMLRFLAGDWDWSRPEVRAGYALAREITEQMRPGFLQLGRDEAVQEFVRGEALFVFTGTWDATGLAQLAPFPVEVARFPQPTPADPRYGRFVRGRVSDGPPATGFEICLNRSTPHRAEAVDFLHFLTSHEGGRIFMAHSGMLTSVRGVEVPRALQPHQAVGDGYNTGTNYLAFGTETMGAFNRHLHRLVGPQGTVEHYLAALAPGYRGLVVQDLQADGRNLLAGLRAKDVEVVATRTLARLEPGMPAHATRIAWVETSQTVNELNASEIMATLARENPPAP
jgi:ABC-type glycerol-3-phosphate transport system substrate-binding protein